MKKNIILILAILIAMALLLSGCTIEINNVKRNIDRIGNFVDPFVENYDGTRDFQQDFEGIEELEIENSVGTIEIDRASGGKGNLKYELKVKSRFGKEDDIQRALDSITVEVVQRDNKLVIKVDHKKDLNNIFENRVVDFKITLPETVKKVKVNNTVGSVDIKRLDLQDLDLRVSVGEIIINDLSSNSVDISSSTGSIEIYKSTIGGRVSTSTGSVDIIDGKIMSSSEISTTIGSLKVNADFEDGGTYQFNSKTGSIELYLSSDFSFKVDARVGLGSIDVDLAMDDSSSNKGEYKGSRNGGRASIYVKTDIGSVEISGR